MVEVRLLDRPAETFPSYPSRYWYEIKAISTVGAARDPLTDGCRRYLEAGGDPNETAVLIRGGKPAMTGNVGALAKLSVSEGHGAPHFVPYKPYPSTKAA